MIHPCQTSIVADLKYLGLHESNLRDSSPGSSVKSLDGPKHSSVFVVASYSVESKWCFHDGEESSRGDKFDGAVLLPVPFPQHAFARLLILPIKDASEAI